ncbi:hypothetical protein BH23PLA1_BH23PLA1_25360 [soil metagenome]
MALVLRSGEEVIPGYRLVKKLGRGGFGEAWQAEAPGEVQVALKFIELDTAAAEPELRALKIIKNVRHPNLLDIQFALSIDHYLVIASPLCDRSLADRLKERKQDGFDALPTEEVSDYLDELAKAVDFLNEPHHPAGDGTMIGIQHRDIKPQNIFLVGGSVRLADFGLAKILECKKASHTGSMTPNYVAPEVLEGYVTETSDQYSLAVTYCEIRGGRLPFTGAYHQIIYAHMHKSPDLEALPPAERPIVERALAKDPGQRWSSCREFERELREASPELSGRFLHRIAARRFDPTSGGATLECQSVETRLPPDARNIAGSEDPGVLPSDDSETLATTLQGTEPAATEPDRVAPPAPASDARGQEKARRGPLPLIGAGLVLVVGVLAGVWFWFESQGRSTGDESGLTNAEQAASPDVEPRLSDAELTDQALAVLDRRCVDCHGIEELLPGLDVGDRRLLLTGKGPSGPFVVPGRPADSTLTSTFEAGRHPPIDPAPGNEELRALRLWIGQGAPLPPPETRRPLGPAHTLETIAEHLEGLDPADRPSRRYFTLTHLHDDPAGWSSRDLRLARAALAKALNGLSWRDEIVRPEPLDEEGTVLASDLRALGWDAWDWLRLLGSYPYGVRYFGANALATRDEWIESQTGVGLPAVRADWFVSAASRPELYHLLLELPETAEELEQRLEVNIGDDLRQGRALRTAVVDSRKSFQNRVMDRHLSSHGPYWRSYSFYTDFGQGDVFNRPLGPAGTFPEFQDQAFVPDYSDLLFSLPNGLLGFMIVDRNGNRIDAAPRQIAVDFLNTTGSPAVVNGISCIACHRLGMVDYQDDLQGHLAVEGKALEQTRRLIPTPEDLAAHIKADRDGFLRALDKTLGPFLKTDKDIDTPIENFPEPIRFLVRRLDAGLDAEAIAAELGIEDADALIEALCGDDRLLELGLEPLLHGHRVSRDTWRKVFPQAVGLGQGTPVDIGL